MIKIIKMTLDRIRMNLGTMLLFVVLYTLCAGVVVTVATRLINAVTQSAAGIYYLGDDNFIRYLTSPLTWVCIILLLLVTGYIQMIQVSGLIWLFNESRQGRKVKLRQVFSIGFQSAGRLRSLKNWSIVFFLVLMLPFLGIFSFSSVQFSVALPGFIMDYIMHHLWLYLPYLAFIIILFILSIRWMLSLQIFVMDPDMDFKEARAKSAELIKGKFLKTVLLTILCGIIWMVIYLAAGFILSVIGVIITGASLVSVLTMILDLAYTLLTPCITLAFISVLCEKLKEQKGMTENDGAVRLRGMHLSKERKISAVIILIVFFASFTYLFVPQIAVSCTRTPRRPDIIAHRGDSANAPENTMPAFLLAESGDVSQWIEFDVRQTKDRQAVISHDDNLIDKIGRTAYIHDMTYEELKDLDVGGWFSDEFKGTYISTLSEMLDTFKGTEIDLMIELKPTPYDQDLEKQVINLIHEKNMAEQCVVTSLNYKTVETVKALDSDITTLYNMTAAAGHVELIPAADYYSIEESSISEEMVQDIHDAGKKIFAWTVNSVESVQFLIDVGVDGILTDEPGLIDFALSYSDYGSGFARLIRMSTENRNFIRSLGI